MSSTISENVKEVDKAVLLKNLNILIVEDEEKQIELIKDAIDDFNASKELLENISIKYTAANSMKDAIYLLLKDNFDAAIIDLKLHSDTSEDHGLELLTLIIDKLRFPIYIRSGTPEKANDFCEIHKFVQSFSKTDRIDDILTKIVDFYKSGVTLTIGTKGIVETYLNEIFWKRLSQSGEWETMINEGSQHERAIVRHCFSLLNEYLEMNDSQDEHLEYHPYEMFIKPPIKKEYNNGDILYDKDIDKYFVLLTPSCDLAQKKYEKLILAEISNFEVITEFVDCQRKYREVLNDGNQDQKDKHKKKILKYTNNSYSPKYHFLPSYLDFPGGFINFQLIESKTKEEIDNMVRFSSLSSKFTKDIISRFSTYVARQGQPNLDLETLFA